MASKKKLTSIPQPKTMPVFGNLFAVDGNIPVQSMMSLAEELGPIYWLDFMGAPVVVVSGVDLVSEISDEKRFDKVVRGPLRKFRPFLGDALFTSDTIAPNWAKAHNILMPTFSQKSMSDYLPMMYDIALQLMVKWERLNSDDEIDVARDMVALTLDTIGLCGFDYRFNSFYRENFHPFIDALSRSMITAKTQRGLPLESAVMRKQLKQFPKDVEYMNNLVDAIIRERRQTGGDQNDLLNFMLRGKDKHTGEGLSDENIRYQINTFLIAGHETTSGLLSFTMALLLSHRDVLARAQAEVDEVLGRTIDEMPTMKQIAQMKYVRAILLEALRLWPTAPTYLTAPLQDEVLGGQYEIPKGTSVMVLVPSVHRDKAYWGDNPDAFDPENFMGDAEAIRHPDAYKPFGNGQRACIGRQFAIQEAILVLGMILQRFELYDHTNYALEVAETLSIKPKDFAMRVKLRDGVIRGTTEKPVEDETADDIPAAARHPSHGTPLTVLYGSNLGATEGFAKELARSGEFNGFDVSVLTLDEAVENVPTKGTVVLASSSYNGGAPDNATKFMAWLETLEPGALDGVTYAMLGCGNSDWAATFQAVPRKIDAKFQELGASRLIDTAELDAKDDIDSQFEEWSGALWQPVGDDAGLSIDFSESPDEPPLYSVKVTKSVTGNPVANTVGAVDMVVTKNTELQGVVPEGEQRSTRHIEVSVPDGISYQPGDHLCVVPKNRPDVVKRMLSRFDLEEDTYIKVDSRSEMRGPFPSGSTFSIKHLAESVGELQAVATRRDIKTLAKYTRCPHTQAALTRLSAAAQGDEDPYRDEVADKRKSVLDLLEEFPACELPLAVFLEIIPFISPRYYSISSSPNATPGKCSITVGVLRGPARSGNGTFEGISSNHLADTSIGENVLAIFREPSSDFRIPEDPNTPVIMIGPGTGLAPFRGFLQERSWRKEQGVEQSAAMLFFGCRHPEQDFYYRSELEQYAQNGLVELHTAFSRQGDVKNYVQDVLRAQGERVWELIEQGAKIFVCGDGARMEPDVRAALVDLHHEKTRGSKEASEAWINEITSSERYVLDVWAG